MRLIDLDSTVDYILDGKYAIEPPKRGYWLKPKDKEYGVCSNCAMNRVDLLDGYEHNYCEVCGAKMEGVKEV